MSFGYNNILNLPERCLLNKKLTKAFFLKNFELTASEIKRLNNQIESMTWLASLQPSNTNIPAIANNDYSYEEIQVIIVKVPIGEVEKDGEKYAELVHKYIPYQLFLIIEDDSQYLISLADKRINQADKNKRTINHFYPSPVLSKLYKNEITEAFYKTITFSQLDKTNLETTYKSCIQAVTQLKTAFITGTYHIRSYKRSQDEMKLQYLAQIITQEIIYLQKQIKKEPQLNGRVKLNIVIHEKRKKIEEIKDKLSKV